MSGIFLVGTSGELTEMNESVYDSEDLLQDLIAKHPEVLSNDRSDVSSPTMGILTRSKN